MCSAWRSPQQRKLAWCGVCVCATPWSGPQEQLKPMFLAYQESHPAGIKLDQVEKAWQEHSLCRQQAMAARTPSGTASTTAHASPTRNGRSSTRSHARSDTQASPSSTHRSKRRHKHTPKPKPKPKHAFRETFLSKHEFLCVVCVCVCVCACVCVCVCSLTVTPFLASFC